MKKLGYILTLLLTVSLPLYAKHVDSETARKVATTFLNNNSAKSNQLVDLSKAAGFPNLYIFSTEESFVIISADDCVNPILGYSLTDKFLAEDMPENLSSWLQGYNDEIQYAIDKQVKNSSETARQWSDLMEGKNNVAKATVVVGPLIQTKWGQGSPYNNLCPEKNSQKAVTGCVATAMAQMMKYWNYPTRGIGSHDYQYIDYGSIFADFGATLYDWANMTNTYSNSSTLAQQTAVATLMYHCGVSLEMLYGPGESSSNTKRSSIAMHTYFNYNTSYIQKNNFTETKWTDTLKYELNNQRPVLYSGNGKGSHAFVCDGYNSDDYFHFNWGWDGSHDDYFRLGLLNPGSYDFSSNQAAVISIYPLTTATVPIVLENNQGTLSWTDTQGCDFYNIYRNNTLIATTTETSYTDPKPSYGINKYYIRGLNGTVLTQPSNYAIVTIDYPSPVVNSLHSDIAVNELALSWNTPDWCFPASADAETFSYVDEERQQNNDSHYSWSEGDYVLSWGHRYLAAILTNYNGKVIHEVSFFSMYPGSFDIVIYQDTKDDLPVEEIARESITTARMGWSRIGFSMPVIIDSSKDLWIFVINTDCKVHTVHHKTTSHNNGSYYSGEDPTQLCYHLSDNTVWLISAYLTDGTYTYNLYNNGIRVNTDPISETSYALTGLDDGLHQFNVKTNYYGGESEASNAVNITIGNTEMGTLALENNDLMVVASNSALTIIGEISNTDPANLIIEDGGQLIHPNYAAEATLKKSINGYGNDNTVKTGWYTIASPINSYNTEIAITETAYDLYAYDEPTHVWLNQKVQDNNITSFMEGYGLLYANSSDQSLDFAGSMKATDDEITVPLSYSEEAGDLKGYNLMGNPFTRNLGSGDITISGTDLTAYYVVEGGSELETRDIENYPIKPGQGFFVQATDHNQELVFNPVSRRNPDDYKPSFIRIDAGNDLFIDRAYVQLGKGNILHKMMLRDDLPKVYVTKDQSSYSAVVVDETTSEMPIHFKAAEDGNYTIRINAENAEFEYLHLIDNLTGTDTDLLQNQSYTFEAKADDFESRFRLLFSATDNPYNDSTDIEGGVTHVMDVTGRIIGTSIHEHLKPGVYILRTVNGNDIKTEKIIIK